MGVKTVEAKKPICGKLVSKRCKVIAEVIDAGHCRYYKKGHKFVLGGFTPAGLCDGAYTVLSRDAQTMRYGGRLPWQKNGAVLTRCPDPRGVVWKLYLVENSAKETIPKRRKQV